MNRNDHVNELLSGYIDGELTQQQRQRVDVHCEQCPECAAVLNDLRGLREEIGSSNLGQYGQDKWREVMNDTAARATYGLGWIILIISTLLLGGVFVYHFITSPGGWFIKFTVAAFYGGLALLLISVLRQRLIERNTDKYKDVEI